MVKRLLDKLRRRAGDSTGRPYDGARTAHNDHQEHGGHADRGGHGGHAYRGGQPESEQPRHGGHH